MKINIGFGYYKLNLFTNIKQEMNINMSLNIFIELFNKKRTRHFFSHLFGQRCFLEAPYEQVSTQAAQTLWDPVKPSTQQNMPEMLSLIRLKMTSLVSLSLSFYCLNCFCNHFEAFLVSCSARGVINKGSNYTKRPAEKRKTEIVA